MALNTRSRYVHLIIDDLKDGFKLLQGYPLEHLTLWLEENTDFYAYIYHDMDVKEEKGQLVTKKPHTHIVALMKQNGGVNKKGQKQYKRFSTILNEIEVATRFPQSTMTISVAKDWIGNCRYLLHLDSPDKFPYSRDNINTNDSDMYDNFIAQQSTFLTVERLYAILEECDYSLKLIMIALGLDTYKKYRLVIRDIVISQYKELQK